MITYLHDKICESRWLCNFTDQNHERMGGIYKLISQIHYGKNI